LNGEAVIARQQPGFLPNDRMFMTVTTASRGTPLGQNRRCRQQLQCGGNEARGGTAALAKHHAASSPPQVLINASQAGEVTNGSARRGWPGMNGDMNAAMNEPSALRLTRLPAGNQKRLTLPASPAHCSNPLPLLLGCSSKERATVPAKTEVAS
jgi:hypothetical protein